MYIGCLASCVCITIFDGFQDRLVLFRHVFCTPEIIIINIAEAQYQFLQLLDHLHQDLVVAGLHDNSMKTCVVSDHILHISICDRLIVFF